MLIIFGSFFFCTWTYAGESPALLHGSKSNVSKLLQLTISLPSPTFRMTYFWVRSTASELRQMIDARVVLYIWSNWSEREMDLIRFMLLDHLFDTFIPVVNLCGPTFRSYQWESPFLIRENWSVMKHDKSGPTIEPSNGGSLRAPV